VLGNGLLGRLAVAVNLGLIRFSKTVFAYQIFVEAETTPDVDFLLEDAKHRSAIRAIRLNGERVPEPAQDRVQCPVGQ
jgi:hypothetical protein